ncbi:hypothetical protein SASPL_122825 [Salvia splendens]|uniref:Uncharacterized protein n=1 Tax=Salvia splendens TaxID=180675 RepID=A0A8X8XM28_SALSN|nr:hypothetical protein SASPL_122825 [Salvia splendens]
MPQTVLDLAIDGVMRTQIRHYGGRVMGNVVRSTGTLSDVNPPTDPRRNFERAIAPVGVGQFERKKSSLPVCSPWSLEAGNPTMASGLDNEYRIECDDDQWDAIVMPIRKLNLCGIISDAADAFRRGQPGTYSEVNENDYHPSLDDIEADKAIPSSHPFGNHDMSSGNSGKQTSVNNGQRKQETQTRRLGHCTNGVPRNFCTRRQTPLGGDFDEDRVGTCNILGDKPQRMEIFMGMQESARLGYLLKLLEDKHNGI